MTPTLHPIYARRQLHLFDAEQIGIRRQLSDLYNLLSVLDTDLVDALSTTGLGSCVQWRTECADRPRANFDRAK